MKNKLFLIIGLLTIVLMGTTNITATINSQADLFPVVNIEVSAQGENVQNTTLWVLPGPRSLDPAVFGTPDQPLMLDWLPERDRNITADGTEYTTTADVTSFSNNTEFIGGSLWVNATDKTSTDDPESMDMAQLMANFTGPMGRNEYYVMLKNIIPVGSDHPFFGGVGHNVMIHGRTGIGQPLLPRIMSQLTLWGVGDLYVNNTLTTPNTNRVVHFMLTPRLRTDDFELGFDVYDPKQLEIHLILPPTKVVDGQPTDSPVQTNYMLPNGAEQPFLHVNFYDIDANLQFLEGRAQTTTIIESTLPTITITAPAQEVTGDKTFGFTGLMLFMSLVAVIPILRKYRKD